MIRITIFYEHVQEMGPAAVPEEEIAKIAKTPEEAAGFRAFLEKSAREIKQVHPNGLHNTLKDLFEEEEDFQVRVALLEEPECGLTEEVLDNTDVLVWWAHIAHDKVPDAIAQRVKDHVLKGMGFIPLHSAHPSKPVQMILGTSGTLQWREGDRARVWCVAPAHPIAAGIPETIELEEEEMYGEPFDIPKPDDLIFISWYAGGEVFRSGATWTRGYGKIFYFQPGHETNRSYYNPWVRQVLKNAVRWAAPTLRRNDNFECPHSPVSAEERYARGQE